MTPAIHPNGIIDRSLTLLSNDGHRRLLLFCRRPASMRDLRREFPDVSSGSIHQSLRQLSELRLIEQEGERYRTNAVQIEVLRHALLLTFPQGMGRAAQFGEPWLDWELNILRRQKYRLLIEALRLGERNRQALMRASRLQSGELSAATATLIQAGIVLPYSLEQVSEPAPHTGALLQELRRPA